MTQAKPVTSYSEDLLDYEAERSRQNMPCKRINGILVFKSSLDQMALR